MKDYPVGVEGEWSPTGRRWWGVPDFPAGFYQVPVHLFSDIFIMSHVSCLGVKQKEGFCSVLNQERPDLPPLL